MGAAPRNAKGGVEEPVAERDIPSRPVQIGRVPPSREELHPDETLWVAIVRGESPVKTSSGDEVAGFHLATLVTRSNADGVVIMAASISTPLDRFEVQHFFTDYTDRNVIPDPDEP